jgi:hypothetical protein
MKTLSSGFTIPWEDFNQALRGEQIFHGQYCPAKKDACLGVWLDRWCYSDNYVVANHGIERITRAFFSVSPFTHKGHIYPPTK